MPDTLYLKQRREGWAFYIAVPRQLQGKPPFVSKAGKPVATIVKGLNTKDIAIAQKLRWPLVNQFKETFERAISGEPLSRAEIDAQARECYTSSLERMEADAARGRPWAWAEPEDEDGDPELAGLSLALDRFGEAREAGEFDFIADEIAAAQRRSGVVVEPGTETYRLLGDALLSAKIAAIHGRMKALQNQSTEPPATFVSGGIDRVTLRPLARVARPTIRTGAGGKKFSEVASEYIAELQRDKGASLTEQTRGQHEMAFRLFGQYVKDAPLSAIDRALASGFLDAVAKLNPNWGRSPQTKTLTIWELIERFGQGKEQLSNKTLNRYVSSLSGLFKWARRRGPFDGANPFSEQSRAKPSKRSTKWLPFTIDELNALFGPEMPKDDAFRWIPLIALFEGMRLGEVCQLRTGDVKRDGAVWFLDVTEEEEERRLKTDAATRRVPIHSELIKRGLLKYVEGLPPGALFPALKPGGPDGKLGWYFSKRFTNYRRDVGVVRRRKAFHSFRENVSTALDKAGVPQADVAALIGHDRGFTFDTYSSGPGLSRLQGIVEKIEYPGLRLAYAQSD